MHRASRSNSPIPVPINAEAVVLISEQYRAALNAHLQLQGTAHYAGQHEGLMLGESARGDRKLPLGRSSAFALSPDQNESGKRPHQINPIPLQPSGLTEKTSSPMPFLFSL